MMQLRPNLQLRHLQIVDGSRSVYSASFHEGVNIISGHNASGKSTIMDFIFYALGGENVPWKNEALLCTDVFAQLDLNGSPITVRRPINEEARSPLSIFWGELPQALNAKFSEWETYPYQRSQSKESFSQVIFRAAGLPELKGEGAANITIHQLLRLMYVDQRTPHDQIFRNEPFDTVLTRETVGNYLCGIYSDKLYDAQLELKTVEARLERSVSDLRNIFVLLGRTGQGGVNTSEFLQAEAASIASELIELRDRLSKLRAFRETEADERYLATNALGRIRTELSEVQKRYSSAVDELAELELENSDSRMFISELERRLAALEDSHETRNYLGAVKFNFCPCCLSKVDDLLDSNVCSLCKTDNQKGTADSQMLRMKNELAIQRRESAKLFEKREEKIQSLKKDVPELKRRLNQLEASYRAASSNWLPPHDREIEEVSQKVGELNQKLAQIAEYQKLAVVIEQLQDARSALEARKSELQNTIESIKSGDDQAKSKVRKAIFDSLIYLLRADLPRQDEFISAGVVDWSFGGNSVSVNGHTQFSESSMVILKHCFHLAMLAASCMVAEMRLPRFLMLDGIEDGGQEIERSHALQRLIVKVSDGLPSSHQIIFATSQIAPELATASLVVGKTSTSQEKTLALAEN